MKKRLIALGMAGILALASSVTTFAEDRKGASGWQVSFDGSKMSNNFSRADMDDEIYAMQPGDSVELAISLKNAYNGQTDWYMRNKVLQTLEDSADAAGGAYDYLLTYTDAEGTTTTLYSSEKFGGEGRYNGEGLKGATTTLDNYFYLDRMGNGDAGVVKLKVALDGETLVNDYQNTLAVLQMDFATELVQPGASGRPGTPASGSGNKREVIKTGDQAEIMRYVLMALGAGLILLIIAFLRMRRDEEEYSAEYAGGAVRSADMEVSIEEHAENMVKARYAADIDTGHVRRGKRMSGVSEEEENEQLRKKQTGRRRR